MKVDASIANTPRKPKGKITYDIVEDRKESLQIDASKNIEEASIKVIKRVQPGVDIEGRWTKKGGNLPYGYKKHIATDNEGLVLSVVTTSANTHDSQPFEDLVNKANLPIQSRIYGDKAYKSKKHDDYIKRNKYKNGIPYKGARGRSLDEREKSFNRLVSKHRYTVARTFGSQVRGFRAGIAKYIGVQKTHGQHVMEGIAYNLKRLPSLWHQSQCAT